MSKPEWHHKFTFLFIPGANQSTRRLRFAAYWLFLFPLVLAVLILMLFVWQMDVHKRFTSTISFLRSEISSQEMQYADLKKEKDETIQQLEHDMLRLSEQTEQFMEQMEAVKQLEEELRNHAMLKGGKSSGLTILGEEASSATHPVQIQAAMTPQMPSRHLSTSWKEWTNVHYESLKQATEEASMLTTSLQDAKQQLDNQLKRLQATPSVWPTRTRRITSTYGYRKDPFTGVVRFHQGLDIDGEAGDPIYATANGVVEAAGYSSSQGHYIILSHGYGLQTTYMHLSSRLVKEGESVQKGSTIGKMGSTGRSTGTHLHYEVHQSGRIQNPAAYLP
ncbi:M23 family metallopeptidase [Marinicrinis sediminis]|uniref:M23 family metallopeptidase n=1 Tax=Marinicrinis sediminis TaxID=1652465 RepID=A0ABW5R7W6_9BACL